MNDLRCLVLLCFCSLFIQTAWAQTPRFDAMYVFGDSLSDNGNDLILTKLLGKSRCSAIGIAASHLLPRAILQRPGGI